MKPRGILPTYVTDTQVTLCKASPTIRNTYEIRLALFMALQTGRSFALAISPNAKLDAGLEKHILQHGGKLVRGSVKDHSVYVGSINRDGEELDGWVAGDGEAWSSILANIESAWLTDRLCIGSSVSMSDLSQFQELVRQEGLSARNVDDEDIREALLRLGTETKQVGGTLFVQ